MKQITHTTMQRIGYEELARRLRDYNEIQNYTQYNVVVNHNYVPEQAMLPQKNHFVRDFFLAFFGVLLLILTIGLFK